MFYTDFIMRIRLEAILEQNWSEIVPNRSGMVPRGPQTLLGQFRANILLFEIKTLDEAGNTYEVSRRPKTVFLL